MRFNKKWCLPLFISLFCVSIGNAQFLGTRVKSDEAGPKGDILVYGSFEYSKVDAPSGSSSVFSSNPLGVGYFINNNDLVGVNVAFSRDTKEGITSKQNEVGLWYSPSVMLGKYFGLIAQFDAHYVWGEHQLQGVAKPEDFTGYRLRAYPMLAVFLGNGWALKFKFGELSMLSTHDKQGWTNSYVSGISGSTFGAGISKTFSFK